MPAINVLPPTTFAAAVADSDRSEVAVELALPVGTALPIVGVAACVALSFSNPAVSTT
jgi:hypothetical protein